MANRMASAVMTAYCGSKSSRRVRMCALREGVGRIFFGKRQRACRLLP